MIRNHRGNALIEFTLAIPSFLALATGILLLSYYIYSHRLIQFELQEAMLCAEEKQRTSQCLDQLSSRLTSALPVGSIVDSSIKIQRREIIGWTHFQILSQLTIQEVQALPRPLSRVFINE